ncbi:DEAD/DEAH box helicase [Luteolibacter luteus]|uniref:DEAD/DEAH box helicase n=1 Tax=Luteolibacter luteus TaxID=2728835 RepID=A0A858RKN6_9BACT|nr:DEAD/DEAH box helicase [Luteolibacter luteus]QJE97866.1 DEAD/DEAH box helicase [Luteolibacter luteus]
MKLKLEGTTIVTSSLTEQPPPTAEEIYEIIFEGKDTLRGQAIASQEFYDLGLQFSDTPASPAILITVDASTPGEPSIGCLLAGKIGSTTAPATLDYVIIDKIWYPLPQNTLSEFSNVMLQSQISNPAALTIGQYLEILKRAPNFLVVDHAAEQLAARTLSKSIPTLTLSGLEATPYDYQQVGIRWLNFMARQGVGSILADEMGLGKTLQVIALLLAEVQANRQPNLVVCPATLTENWRREITQFAPSLKVLVHAGPSRTGLSDQLAAAHITVTSYETMAGDISIFRVVPWNVVALDEAQNIKNPTARRTKRAKELPRRIGIAITGTPVENNLKDLWSLFDYALPGHLGTLSEFQMQFPETETGAKELESLVSPIMLRRRICDVAADLPPRIDVPIAITMDDRSSEAYDEILKEAAAKAPEAPGLAALVHLRMFCAHPWSVGKLRDVSLAIACSPKLERSFEILEEVFTTNSKVIIFTSFNYTARLLEREIKRTFRVPTWLINGSVAVTDRQSTVDEFTRILGSAALILNPKAAGVGLNITAANHVIHYNLEWNPAVEDQASARSHRRGQTRPVTIHRLFYADTVEEVIYDRMIRKRILAENAVIGTTGDADDLVDILNALKLSPRIKSS